MYVPLQFHSTTTHTKPETCPISTRNALQMQKIGHCKSLVFISLGWKEYELEWRRM